MKYTAINIGPIISTLGMARKPRELWAASYLFSHLLKCIYVSAERGNAHIISPSKPEQEKNDVGIYPDRLFVKGELDVDRVLKDALEKFYFDLYPKSEEIHSLDLSYFNIMSASCEAEKDSCAIANLNQKLDVLELCNYATDNDSAQSIYSIISAKAFSPLFQLAKDKDRLPIPDLESIAKIELSNSSDIKIKSHHKYFCVIQADGDNVGKTISHKDLNDGDALRISDALVNFGLLATQIIKDYGGLPIYAGGDDLLFIAPVIGKKGRHVFELLDDIEFNAFKGVHDLVDSFKLRENDAPIEASLSFGVSISYYKYPLYEALESARTLLFKIAKQIGSKQSVAWSLRKHSGGTFDAVISRKDNELRNAFKNLIEATTDDETVSAVAHKILQEKELVNLVLNCKDRDNRLDALFDKVLEFDTEKEGYFKSVKTLMPILYNYSNEAKNMNYSQLLYSILRTAKFIKGEDLHDE